MAAVSVFPSPGELGAALARSVAEAAAEAVASGGRFTLGLSGGSLVQLLARELPPALSAVAGSEPSRWLVAFCDERLVPLEHPESTGGAYRAQLLSQLAAPPQVLWVRSELGPAEAAREYEGRLRQAFPGEDPPQFDLLLLGVGPDGHTCSLFPGHALLQEQNSLISLLEDSPKLLPRGSSFPFISHHFPHFLLFFPHDFPIIFLCYFPHYFPLDFSQFPIIFPIIFPLFFLLFFSIIFPIFF
ncbi:6-phosphogluconolactonase isoform X3 [Zonotrichia albicollis]|uniref:6-phosphogluconolactonase isoform X3 n=1 Tax=Zonotrichia albicollis TaxID=44394 RepID=UPI003D80BE95